MSYQSVLGLGAFRKKEASLTDHQPPRIFNPHLPAYL